MKQITDNIIRDAVIVDTYRYRLSRIWNDQLPFVLFIMLNPSTADAIEDDATIKRCIGFAKSWGYGGLYVGNLFAWRSTKPEELYFKHNHGANIVGAENDEHLYEMGQLCQRVVFAWGNDGGLLGRCKDVSDQFKTVYSFGITKHNHPKHPLYLSGKTGLTIFQGYK